jgi:hypothetical protein
MTHLFATILSKLGQFLGAVGNDCAGGLEVIKKGQT